ncbi:hypothetical protein R6Z07M_015587 [Ovis aries]
MPGRPPLRSEPPLGGWPGLARAAGALTQPQPAQPCLGSAPRAPRPAPPASTRRSERTGLPLQLLPGACPPSGPYEVVNTLTSRGGRWYQSTLHQRRSPKPPLRDGGPHT